MSEATTANAEPVPVPAPEPPPAPPPEPVDVARCLNCGAVRQGPFCYACGQPEKGLIRHLSGIIGDFLDTVFSIDSRTLRTLGPLYFKPGFLSNEYFAGRRVRYVTPLRLYFFLSLIAFLVISLVANPTPASSKAITTDLLEETKTSPEERERRLAELEQGLKFLPASQAAKIRAEVEAGIKAETAGAREREKAARIQGAIEEAQEDDMPRIVLDGNKVWHETENPLKLSWLTDGMNASLNAEIGEVLRKSKRINKDPGPFFRQAFSLAPQTLFIILPIFAVLLKIVYIFKRRFYTEHLIVALHSHSFICLSLILIILLAKTQSWAAGVALVPGIAKFLLVLVSIWIGLYLLLMQKRVYKQGWIMTLLKFGFVGLCYSFLLGLGMVGTMLASIILL